MKEYATDKIRNVCLAGQRSSGKTSLADTFAFHTGVTTRIGRVDEGSSLLDFHDYEIARKTSISASLLACEWQNVKLNILDCPGHLDFAGELMNCARVVESVGFIINGTAGVEIGTKLQWKALESFNLAHFFFVNKMEMENVKWQTNLESLKEAFGKQAVAVEIPIGEGDKFTGLIDLLHMKAYTFEKDGKRSEIPIPADMKAIAEAEREKLVEVAAEADDTLIEKFFSEGTLTEDEFHKGLALGIDTGRLYPVFFGSALRGVGSLVLLDFIVEYLPSPKEMGNPKGLKTGTTNEVELKVDSSAPTVAYIFKTASEGHLGEMSYFRVFQGTIKQGIDLKNQATEVQERASQVYTMQGKNRIDLPAATAGDMGVLVKLKNTHTGNTLTDAAFGVTIAPPKLPNPVMDVALKPKNKGDEEKIGTGLHKLHEEDPSFKLISDPALHQMVLWGQGSTHIEILVDKLKKRFGVDVELTKPKIPYRETITSKTEHHYRHKKQSGGRGQFGDVHIRIEPNKRGGGFEFLNEVTGGAIPAKYIPAVEKGVVEQMLHGGLAHAPVVDVRVALFYGSYHDVDSSDMAFKIAGLMAFKEGFMNCKPVILEPIYSVEIHVPEDYAGDVMGDLSSRRGRIAGMDPDGSDQIIRATVPQAELYQYAVDLRSMTQGQGVYTMTFSHYEEVPHEVAQKIIEETRHLREAAQLEH